MMSSVVRAKEEHGIIGCDAPRVFPVVQVHHRCGCTDDHEFVVSVVVNVNKCVRPLEQVNYAYGKQHLGFVTVRCVDPIFRNHNLNVFRTKQVCVSIPL